MTKGQIQQMRERAAKAMPARVHGSSSDGYHHSVTMGYYRHSGSHELCRNGSFYEHAKDDILALSAEVERLRESHRKMHRRAQAAESRVAQLQRWIAAFGGVRLMYLVFPQMRIPLLKKEIADLHDRVGCLGSRIHTDPQLARRQAMMIEHTQKTIARREARLVEAIAEAEGEA